MSYGRKSFQYRGLKVFGKIGKTVKRRIRAELQIFPHKSAPRGGSREVVNNSEESTMREPKIFTRKRRHGVTFYVEIDGQQINLDTDMVEAQQEYHRRMSNRQNPTSQMPVVALIDRTLDRLGRDGQIAAHLSLV